MLYQLYLAPAGAEPAVRITHDIEIDCYFWASRGRGEPVLLAADLPLWIADRIAGSMDPGRASAEGGVGGRVARWRLGRTVRRLGGRAALFEVASLSETPVPLPDPAYLLRVKARLAGRRLLLPELAYHVERSGEPAGLWLLHALQLLVLEGGIRRLPAVGWRSGRLRCLRCGGYEAVCPRPCATCGRPDCPWCEECSALGPCRGCLPLFDGAGLYPGARRVAQPGGAASHRSTPRPTPSPEGEPGVPPGPGRLALPYPLTPAQQEAAAWLRGLVEAGCPGDGALLWAACGAGKTEVLLPALEAALGRGLRVLLTVPRRDVVVELAERFARFFPDTPLGVFHGGLPAVRAGEAPLTLATTHQLLRFSGAFDLVVLDEADAFPFVGSPMLHRALAGAARPAALRVYLTATPDDRLRAEARSGRLAVYRLPARHHGRPLPVPRWIRGRPLLVRAGRTALAEAAAGFVRDALAAGAPLFVFVPDRAKLGPVASSLRAFTPQVATVWAGDRGRDAKRAAFRAGRVRVLVTTTVSERGITIPRARVLVLWADAAPVFRREVLVQIAGRSGRSEEEPEGAVAFVAERENTAMHEARREIEAMNREAAERGFLRAI